MTRAWLVCALILISLLLPAGGSLFAEGRSLLLFYRNETNSANTISPLLFESLLSSLASGESSPSVGVFPAGWESLSLVDLDREAFHFGADAWLCVRVIPQGDAYGVEFELKDLLSDEAFSGSYSYPVPGFRDMKDLFWYDVAQAVREYLPERSEERALRVQALPGTRLTGIPGRRTIKVGPSGAVRFPGAGGGMLTLRAEKPGYYPEELIVRPGEGLTEISFHQERGAKALFDVYTWNAQFFGAEFGVYTLPGEVFLKTGITSYLLGLYLPDEYDTYDSLIISLSLLQFHIKVGCYLTDADALVRLYGTAGVFSRIILSSAYVGVDTIAPFGFQPAIGLEFSRLGAGKLFFEYAPTLYVGEKAGMLADTSSSENHMPYLGSEYFFFEPIAFKFGVRWQLGGRHR